MARVEKHAGASGDADVDVVVRDGFRVHHALRKVKAEAQVLLEKARGVHSLVELADVLEVDLDVFLIFLRSRLIR